MRGGRRTLAGVVAVAALAGLGALTRVPYAAGPEERAELRLAWRARVPRVASCRRLTQEEQAELPVHMRREEVCEGRVASYRLEVTVDGRRLRSTVVKGAGARGDRPLYVFDEVPLPPGSHALTLEFARIGAAGEARQEEEEESRGGERAAVPDRLVLRDTVMLRAGEAALVTYDPERRRLVLRHGPGG